MPRAFTCSGSRCSSRRVAFGRLSADNVMAPALLGFLFFTLLFVGPRTPALAAPITFDFSGTITAFPTVPPDPFGGTICDGTNCSPASTFTGSYTFNSAAPNTIASTTQGSYQQAGSPFGLSVTIGGHLFSTSDFLAINTQHTAGFFDFYGVLACTSSLGPPSCSTPVTADGDLSVSLAFSDPTGTALGTNALPLSPPDLTKFANESFMLLTQVSGNPVELDGNITSLTCATGCVTTVPEPATLLLVGAGLSSLGILGWCKRRHSHNC